MKLRGFMERLSLPSTALSEDMCALLAMILFDVRKCTFDANGTMNLGEKDSEDDECQLLLQQRLGRRYEGFHFRQCLCFSI